MAITRIMGRVGCAMLVLGAIPALAQSSFPSKPIVVVSPFPPGASDALMREIGQPLSERLGQQIVIENRPGATGLIGMQSVARAEPDGHRLLFTSSSMSIVQSVVQNPGIDVRTNLTPISRILQGIQAVWAPAGAPYNNFREFIAYAKANPGKLNYGSSGNGGLIHVSMELIKQASGTNIVHIPYQGGAPAMTALISNEVQVHTYDVSLALPQMQAGKIKMLAVLSRNRSPQFPDVQTVSETLPGVSVIYWYGFLGPANTPRPIVDRLYREMDTVLKQPALVASLSKKGYVVGASTPEEFGRDLASEVETWARVVKQGNIPLQ